LKQPNLFDGIIVDNFAGGGGASTGIKQAMGGGALYPRPHFGWANKMVFLRGGRSSDRS
jgi:hypothetical protein